MVSLFLHGLATEAQYIAFTSTGWSVAFDKEQDDPEPTPADVMAAEWFKENYRNTEVVRIEKRQTYYWLPLDCYNQPLGYVEEVSLFPSDYNNIIRAHSERKYQLTYPYYWIFTSKDAAEQRAID